MKSNTVKKAELEFKILKETVKDAVILPFEKEILTLVDKFGNSGQSGGSAPYTAGAISQAIKKLLLHKPICDITGNENEWNLRDGGHYQNLRLSSVFKESKESTPYYLNAIVFQGVEKWDTFTGSVYKNDSEFELIKSRQFIKLPFKPKTFYLDVLRVDITKEEAEKRGLHYIEGNGECYYSVLKNENQLKEVYEYYVKS